jgi:hypothetical protein
MAAEAVWQQNRHISNTGNSPAPNPPEFSAGLQADVSVGVGVGSTAGTLPVGGGHQPAGKLDSDSGMLDKAGGEPMPRLRDRLCRRRR